jgi:D-psicose/D-tagatose/L-ribulose 3-epimerase
MKLAISNIAWERYDDPEIFKLLLNNGVEGIEVAPTKIWPDWEGISEKSARKCSAILHNEGFSVPAFQSIFYRKPELKIFGSKNSRIAFLEHIKFVLDIALCFEAKVLVFGSPKNRSRRDLPLNEALNIAYEFFPKIGNICADYGVFFAIEMNPPHYGCDFLNNSFDLITFIEKINHPSIKLHIDTAAMKLGNEDETSIINNGKDNIAHFHISEPFLGNFDKPESNHVMASKSLNQIVYKKWVSIEMNMVDSPKQAIKTAIDFVNPIYLNHYK